MSAPGRQQPLNRALDAEAAPSGRDAAKLFPVLYVFHFDRTATDRNDLTGGKIRIRKAGLAQNLQIPLPGGSTRCVPGLLPSTALDLQPQPECRFGLLIGLRRYFYALFDVGICHV